MQAWIASAASSSQAYSEMASSGRGRSRSVLFVCTGNICRSPMAETVFIKEAKDKRVYSDWPRVDSAGTTDWNEGSLPDYRAAAVLEREGLKSDHRSRKIKKDDFRNFDYILVMDDDNMRQMNKMKPLIGCKAKILYLGSFDARGDRVIADPYYGSEFDFERAFDQIKRSCQGFLASASR